MGGPPAVQLLAALKSALPGLASQVALPAKLLLTAAEKSVRMAIATGRKESKDVNVVFVFILFSLLG